MFELWSCLFEAYVAAMLRSLLQFENPAILERECQLMAESLPSANNGFPRLFAFLVELINMLHPPASGLCGARLLVRRSRSTYRCRPAIQRGPCATVLPAGRSSSVASEPGRRERSALQQSVQWHPLLCLAAILCS